MPVSSQIEIITPEEAADILDNRNLRNRPMSAARYRPMLKEMREGLWQDGVGSISFDTHNILLDGQHRLMACMRSKRPLTLTVVRGLPPGTATAIDVGRNMTASDVLHMHGVSNSKTVATAIRKILGMQACFGGGSLKRLPSCRTTNADIAKWCLENWEIRDSAHKAHKFGRDLSLPLGMPYATQTAIHWITGHRSESDRFLWDLSNGEGLCAGDPVLALRHLLWERASDNRKEDAAMLALYIHVWNARQEGRQLRWYDARTLTRRLSLGGKRRIPEDAIRIPDTQSEFPQPLPPAEKPHVYVAKQKAN